MKSIKSPPTCKLPLELIEPDIVNSWFKVEISFLGTFIATLLAGTESAVAFEEPVE